MLPSVAAPRVSGESTPWHSKRFSRGSVAERSRIAPALVDQLASLVAPPLCAACGARCPAEGTLCGRCDADLVSAPRVVEPGPPGIDLAIAASPFEGAA